MPWELVGRRSGSQDGPAGQPPTGADRGKSPHPDPTPSRPIIVQTPQGVPAPDPMNDNVRPLLLTYFHRNTEIFAEFGYFSCFC